MLNPNGIVKDNAPPIMPDANTPTIIAIPGLFVKEAAKEYPPISQEIIAGSICNC